MDRRHSPAAHALAGDSAVRLDGAEDLPQRRAPIRRRLACRLAGANVGDFHGSLFYGDKARSPFLSLKKGGLRLACFNLSETNPQFMIVNKSRVFGCWTAYAACSYIF